jgi:hypothetical protein
MLNQKHVLCQEEEIITSTAAQDVVRLIKVINRLRAMVKNSRNLIIQKEKADNAQHRSEKQNRTMLKETQTCKRIIMEEQRNEQDRHLQTPAEANRDKHINFLAEERNEGDPADDNRDTLVHFGDSTYQTKEEFQKDKNDLERGTDDDSLRPSDMGDETLGDKIAGSDRTGTSELSSQQNSETSNLTGTDSKNASAEPGM